MMPGRMPVAPRSSRVGGDGETDALRPARREAGDLEGCDHLRAPGECVRLRLARVLRAAAAEEVGRDPAADPLAVAGDAVGGIGSDEVDSAAARDVVAAAAGDVDPVGPASPRDPVRALGSQQQIRPRRSDDQPCSGGGGEDQRDSGRREQAGPSQRAAPSVSGDMNG